MKMDKWDTAEKAVEITARYSEFTGDNWQGAYFTLLSLKNSYNAFYKLDILPYRNEDAYVYALVKPNYAKSVLEYMESDGYKVNKKDTTIVMLCEDFDQQEELDEKYDYNYTVMVEGR